MAAEIVTPPVSAFDSVDEFFLQGAPHWTTAWAVSGFAEVPPRDRWCLPAPWLRDMKCRMKWFKDPTAARAWMKTITPEERARRCAEDFDARQEYINDMVAETFQGWRLDGFKENYIYVKGVAESICCDHFLAVCDAWTGGEENVARVAALVRAEKLKKK